MARAVRVFVCFALGYLLSYALRSINAVIAPSLVDEIGLSNADLGLLSSACFVSFGCVQLPLGIWLDKYGPRRTGSALLLCAALGAAVFASSTSLAGLWMLATSSGDAWLLWPLMVLFVPVTTLVQAQVSLAFPAALAVVLVLQAAALARFLFSRAQPEAHHA